jgi:acetyl esterase/lipase
MFRSVLSCVVFIFSFSVVAQSQIIQFAPVPANVPYSKIAELEPAPSDKKIVYGEATDNYILYWKPHSQANSESNFQSNSNSALGAKNAQKVHAQNNQIVFIHGGCWLAQFSIDHSLALTSALAQQGFDVFSVEYRRTGNGGEWPVALNDIKSAVAAIQAMQTDTNEPRLLTLVGHSAGGHLASLAAADIAKSTQNIHFVGLAPIIDLPAYAIGENSCQTATPGFMQGTPSDKAPEYATANPLNYNLSGLASAVSFTGGQDNIVPSQFAMHPQTTLSLAPDAGHFDWIHPGSDAFKRLVEHLTLISQHNAK